MTQVPTIDDFNALTLELQDMKTRLYRLESRPKIDYVTVTVAAKTLGMTKIHVRRLCHEGVLKAKTEGGLLMVDVNSLQDKAINGKGKSNKKLVQLSTVKTLAQMGRPRKTKPPVQPAATA